MHDIGPHVTAEDMMLVVLLCLISLHDGVTSHGSMLSFAVTVDHVRQVQRYVLLSLLNRMRHVSTVIRQLHSLVGAI